MEVANAGSEVAEEEPWPFDFLADPAKTKAYQGLQVADADADTDTCVLGLGRQTLAGWPVTSLPVEQLHTQARNTAHTH